MKLLIFGFLCYVHYVTARPNGSPQDACFYMTPRHIHPHTFRKVFPTKAMGLYNITTSADVYRPDRPIRVTLWGPPFKGFMMVAAEEGAKDWPTGIFYSEDGSAKRLGCLGRGDTVTHQNNSYKDSVSVLWYGPESMMSEQIQFIATVVVNLTIYYTNIKSGFLRLDPTLHAQGAADGGVAGAVTMDPWLAGNTATRSPWYSNLAGGGTGAGTGNSPWSSLASLLGGNLGGNNQGWGSKTGSSWGSGTGSNAWGSGTSGTGGNNFWQQSGQGSGTPSSGNSWGNNGWQQWGQPSNGGNTWGGSGAANNYPQGPSQSYQTTPSTYQTTQATGGKTKAEIWNWNWNQGSKAAGTTPAPTTAGTPQQTNQPVTGSMWSGKTPSSSQLSTNVWAKLLDFILKQTDPKTPAA